MAYCSECGAEVSAGEKFCKNCGTKIKRKKRRSAVAAPKANQPETKEVRPASYAETKKKTPQTQGATLTTARSKPKKKGSAAVIVIVIVFALFFIMVMSENFSFNGPTSEPTHWIEAENGYYYAHYEWDYKRTSWTYDAEVPVEFYNYFASEPRSSHDYARYVDNPDDDEWINDLANDFVIAAEEKGWNEFETVSFALAFIQSMPYTSDTVTTGYDEYPRYPIETIVDGGGDCEDTSILFSSIVREMGYGTVLLWLKEDAHMAVGVSVSWELIDSWRQNYSITYYSHNGGYYAYCETTGEGWELGEMPGDLIGTATILDV